MISLTGKLNACRGYENALAEYHFEYDIEYDILNKYYELCTTRDRRINRQNGLVNELLTVQAQ